MRTEQVLGQNIDVVRFVAAAVSKDKTREYLCGVHIEETAEGCRVIGTDGKRLHIGQVSQHFPAGEYAIEKNTKSTVLLSAIEEPDWQYPDTSRVIPEKTENGGEYNFCRDNTSNKFGIGSTVGRLYHDLVKETGAIVNTSYLEPMIGREWTLSWKGAEDALRFDNCQCVAVIMPMQAIK